jgi:type II secretory pathway pseudopilin PulG
MRETGFTLIELLVIAGIVIFLSALIIPFYKAGQSQFALQRASHKLAQDIRRAQEMAVSAKEFRGGAVAGGYGIYLQTGLNSYILFADVAENQMYDGSAEQVENCQLEKGVTISWLSPTPLNIVFSPPDPEIFINLTAQLATIELASQGKKQQVTVNKAGLIEIK